MAPAAGREVEVGPLLFFHLVVFLGFAASAIAAAWPELHQVHAGLSHAYHTGTPPFLPVVLGAALALLGALALLARLRTKRGGALPPSLAVLVGFALSLTNELRAPELRSPAGANLAFLDAVRAVHLELGEVLQRQGAAPADEGSWLGALRKAALAKGLEHSPYRTRSFRALPWRVSMQAGQGLDFSREQPGTLLVWVSKDRVQYQAALIGLSSTFQPARLRDSGGGLVELKGVFNPDTRAIPAP